MFQLSIKFQFLFMLVDVKDYTNLGKSVSRSLRAHPGEIPKGELLGRPDLSGNRIRDFFPSVQEKGLGGRHGSITERPSSRSNSHE